jgi:hypothetical protein
MGRTNRSLIISLLLLAVSLVTVTVVLADYLGPDRTTTVVVWRRLRCSYLAEHDDPGPGGYYACTLNMYRTPSSGCPSTGSVEGYFSASACGWPKSCSDPNPLEEWSCSISGSSSTEGCSSGDSGCEGSTQTVNQPPATISGSISCANPGSNGWCRSASILNLTGTEPISGYSITALEGTRNGDTFACAGSSCSVDLLEGQNDFTYWALSSWGDSSTMGSASGKVDTQPPVISGTLTGTLGDNGWYVSDVTISASASDAMSGLQSFEINVDGGGYQPYAETTLDEGTHTILLHAVDNAGHVSQVSQSFSVDKTLPQLALSGGGSFCPGCGDVLSLSYDVQDALSGISSWTLSASGAVIASSSAAETAIVDWGGSGLGGGTHTLTLTARDAAGNQSTASLSIVLNTPPEPTSVAVIAPRARVVTPFPPRATAGSPLDSGLAQREPSRLTFESAPPEPQRALVQPAQSMNSTQPASPQATASPVLWGGAAAGLIGAAMAVAMEAQRKRKEEEARQIAEMNRINADSRAREKGYQSHADMVEKQRQAAWDAAFLEALAAEQERKRAVEQATIMGAMATEEAERARAEDEVEKAWLEKKTTAATVKEKDDSEEVKSKSGFKLAMPAMKYFVEASSALAAKVLPSGASKSDKLDVSKGEAGLEAAGAKAVINPTSGKYSGSVTNPQRPAGVSAVKWALLSREDRLEIAADHEARMLRVNPPWLLDSGRPVSIDKEDWKYYDAEDRRKAVADVRKMWDTWLDNGYEGDFEIYARGGLLYWSNGYLNIKKEPGNNNRRIIQLSPNTKLSWTGISIHILNKGEIEIWYKVKYIQSKGKNKGKEYIGWVPWRLVRTSQPWRASLYEPELTTNKSQKYGGEDMKELFDLMKSKKGAWWYDDGNFTYDEFIGLIMIHEANITLPELGRELSDRDKIIGEMTCQAFAQQLYVGGWLPAYSPSGISNNGPLNMLAGYSQCAHEQIDKFIAGDLAIEEYFGLKNVLHPNEKLMNSSTEQMRIQQYMNIAREFGRQVLYPNSVNFDRYNALTNFGAEPLTTEKVNSIKAKAKALNIDIEPDTFYSNGNNGIFYFSKDGDLLFESVNGDIFWFGEN